MDAAHEWTDERIARLERVVKRIYADAMVDIRAELERWLAEYGEELERRLEEAENGGEEAVSALERWQTDTLASIAAERGAAGGVLLAVSALLLAADSRARSAVNGAVPDVFAGNYGYMSRMVGRIAERKGVALGIRFDLMDEQTAKLLIEGRADLLPKVKRNAAKNARWNRRKVYSAISQGIRQGESVPKIADRIESVSDMSRGAAVRAARTACTAAENLGRLESLRRAKALGIDVKKRWLSTLDQRTRPSHRQLYGEVREIEERFSNGLMCPGDPNGSPQESWNCRCAMPGVLDGTGTDEAERWSKLPDGMGLEEWKAAKPVYKAGGKAGK